MEDNSKTNLNKKLFIFASIIIITSLHYLTTTEIHVLHDIYQRLYYIPIISAAIWFGMKGGFSASFFISLVYIGHILFQWKIMPHVSLQKFLEILIFNMVGALTGLLAEREQNLKNMYHETAGKLKESYEKLKKRTKEMIEIEEQLRRADKLTILGQVSAELAHEIRNPLGSIKGTVEIIKKDYSPEDKKYEFIEILTKETNRLNDVLNNFLRFSKEDVSTLSMVDVNLLINNVVNFLKIQSLKKNVKIELEFDDGLKNIELEGEQLKQVFYNIILNGIQAMPDGGTLSIVTRTEGIKDNENNATGYLCIDFKDTGVGIDDESLNEIFKPFFTSKDEGTGLGLSISQKIIEKFDGKIIAKSRLNEGTTFTVKLPYVKRRKDE